jgi:hypothetical protein
MGIVSGASNLALSFSLALPLCIIFYDMPPPPPRDGSVSIIHGQLLDRALARVRSSPLWRGMARVVKACMVYGRHGSCWFHHGRRWRGAKVIGVPPARMSPQHTTKPDLVVSEREGISEEISDVRGLIIRWRKMHMYVCMFVCVCVCRALHMHPIPFCYKL